jgi:maleamate amidohydrolase
MAHQRMARSQAGGCRRPAFEGTINVSGHPEADIYHRQGMGNRAGLGERPALVIVDFVVGFADPAHFGGGNIGPAIEQTAQLLAFARRQGWPVAHTRVVYAEDGSDAGVFTLKAPSLRTLTEASPLSQIVPDLTPLPGELVVRKQGASGFFDTNLAGWLAFRRVDTVAVAGCTTSGCVRATVVDAMQHNLRTICVTDCVGDRAIGPHEANLFDIGQKYADLMTRAELETAWITPR